MALKLSPTQIAFNARGDGSFKQPFAEQVDFFRQKLNLPTERYDDILKSAHDRAFVVAGAMKADLLNDLRGAVDAAISDGESIGAFRARFESIVRANGWEGWTGSDTQPGRDWRTRVIYTTNMRTSYAAGRYQQLKDPELLAKRPYWKYVHNDTVQTPRELHVSWSGLVLPHDDPWWDEHYPPNGFGCRCRVVAVRAKEYKGEDAPNDGTYEKVDRNGEIHVLPNGVDYGWDYAPGASRRDEIADIAAIKADALPGKLAKKLDNDVEKLANKPSVADFLTLPKTGFAKAPAVKVMAIIDALHSVDDLPKIPIKNSTSQSFQGAYTYYKQGNEPVKISLSNISRNPELTLAHEIGHFIDHQSIGLTLGFSSIDDPIFDNWRNAVKGSEATKKLRAFAGQKRADYYLSTHEQWARSYSQWVATKSGYPVMTNQINSILGKKNNLIYSNSQWQPNDFEPILKAIDELFALKGYLK